MNALAFALDRRSIRWLLATPLVVAALLFLGSAPSHAAPAPLPVGWSPGPSLPTGYQSRWNVSYAYDAQTDQVVLFGGSPGAVGDVWKNDTWIYSPSTDAWTQGPAAPGGLTPRGGAAMAYDPAIGKVVLFGGAGSTWPPENDTWLWNGTSWSPGPAAPAGLEGREGAEMVYDDALGKLVLFGGSGDRGYKDTWLFNGTSWTVGPAAPAGMPPRAYFGMTYDPDLQQVLLAGGDGQSDVWVFNGTSWAPGPDLPAGIGPRERISLAYDPQLGVDVMFGGIGPGSDYSDTRYLEGGVWTYLVPDPGATQLPGGRFDAGVLFVPTRDALMLITGVVDQGGGTELKELWWFREVPPQASSVTLSPANPDPTQDISMSVGTVTGGYISSTIARHWFVNDVLQSQSSATLFVGNLNLLHDDRIQAKVQYTDSLGVSGPWVASPVLTVIDRAPSVRSVTLLPASPTATDTITASPDATDPDGDTVTFTYQWTVDGVNVSGNNQPTLTPSHFAVGKVVRVTVTPTDSLGMSGAALSSPPSTVVYNLSWTQGSVKPGGKSLVKGAGYNPNENVDVRLDSPTGAVLATFLTDTNGAWVSKNVTFPASLAGGTHLMYGVGQSSGKVGAGPVLVTPSASITPAKFASGASVSYKGVGFLPGETVSVSFPGKTPMNVTADASGNATVNLVSPPEPSTGGNITGVATSGTVAVPFSVTSVLTIPATGAPNTNATVSVTGYRAGETVNFSIDTGPTVASGVTDAAGSLTKSVPLSGFFGNHAIKAKGVSSAILLSKNISYKAAMTLTPSSGPGGTVVTVTSGPGWKPGESLTFKVGTKTMAPKTVASDGTVSFTYSIPMSQAIGSLKFVLTSTVLVQTATTTFTVTG